MMDAKDDTATASRYVREFAETAKCDGVARDLSGLRNALEMKMASYSMGSHGRVLRMDEKGRDVQIAAQAVAHYGFWHRKELVKSLSWPQWLCYHTFYKAETTLSRVHKSLG